MRWRSLGVIPRRGQRSKSAFNTAGPKHVTLCNPESINLTDTHSKNPNNVSHRFS